MLYTLHFGASASSIMVPGLCNPAMVSSSNNAGNARKVAAGTLHRVGLNGPCWGGWQRDDITHTHTHTRPRTPHQKVIFIFSGTQSGNGWQRQYGTDCVYLFQDGSKVCVRYVSRWSGLLRMWTLKSGHPEIRTPWNQDTSCYQDTSSYQDTPYCIPWRSGHFVQSGHFNLVPKCPLYIDVRKSNAETFDLIREVSWLERCPD